MNNLLSDGSKKNIVFTGILELNTIDFSDDMQIIFPINCQISKINTLIIIPAGFF
jgi:hypothetical protein